MKTVFLRVLEASDKAAALLGAVEELAARGGKCRFEVDPATFADLPRSPFAYWIGPSIISLFQGGGTNSLVPREAKNGLGTLADFRFVRLAVEVPAGRGAAQWWPFSKGGRRAPFYQDVVTCVRWLDDGAEVKAHIEQVYNGGHWSRNARSVDYYFRPGLTWPLRGVCFSAQAVPAGGIFSVGGKMLFSAEHDLLLLLAFLNSTAFDLLVRVFAGKVGGVQYESGLVEQIPVAAPADVEIRLQLESAARRAWSLSRSLDTRKQTSHAFTLPAPLQVAGTDIAKRASAWSAHVCTVESELAGIQAEIDERCFELYGIGEEDRRAIVQGFGAGDAPPTTADDANDGDSEGEGDDGSESESVADSVTLAAELVSWAIGVAFGRFDVRLASGDRPMPSAPEPFDALPVCSPGMLTGADGLPVARPPAGYPLDFPDAGVLVDDPGHPLDLISVLRAVFDVVFGSCADRWWNDVGALLDPKNHHVRGWLAASFFEYHIKRYSKSRRRAPILWQLGTPSGSYSAWLYAHRLTADSFFRLQNDVVGPKLAHEERLLTNVVQDAGGSPSPSQRREIVAQETFVEELRAMLAEVKRVAPLWNPDLDDGVIINFAPLWRLVPQHRAWQKECKDCWDKLVAGEYDWAHLAMHLWPERVVPKCADDRSLAIAHGLEDVFWTKDSDGKWRKRNVDSATVGRLAAERTSSAVKDALRSLLDAPSPSAGRGRSKKLASPRRASSMEAVR